MNSAAKMPSNNLASMESSYDVPMQCDSMPTGLAQVGLMVEHSSGKRAVELQILGWHNIHVIHLSVSL